MAPSIPRAAVRAGGSKAEPLAREGVEHAEITSDRVAVEGARGAASSRESDAPASGAVAEALTALVDRFLLV